MADMPNVNSNLNSAYKNLQLSEFGNVISFDTSGKRSSVNAVLNTIIGDLRETIKEWKAARLKKRDDAGLHMKIYNRLMDAFKKAGYVFTDAGPEFADRALDRASLGGIVYNRNDASPILLNFFEDLEAYAAGRIRAPEDITNPGANPNIKARRAKLEAWDKAKPLIDAYDKESKRTTIGGQMEAERKLGRPLTQQEFNALHDAVEKNQKINRKNIEKAVIQTFLNNGYIYTDYTKKKGGRLNHSKYPLNESFPLVRDVLETIGVVRSANKAG